MGREWGQARIRILRGVDTDAAVEPARKALSRLVGVARVDAETAVVLLDQPFPEVLHHQSSDAGLIFLGFEPVPVADAGAFHGRYQAMLADMPTTVLVSSTGDADLLA